MSKRIFLCYPYVGGVTSEGEISEMKRACEARGFSYADPYDIVGELKEKFAVCGNVPSEADMFSEMCYHIVCCQGVLLHDSYRESPWCRLLEGVAQKLSGLPEFKFTIYHQVKTWENVKNKYVL